MVLGGYRLPGADETLRDVPWFSLKLCPTTAAWAFERGRDQAFRVIATLELLTTLFCVRASGRP